MAPRDREDRRLLVGLGEVHVGGLQLTDRGVAPLPGEDEDDRRQQVGPLQHPDHLGAVGGPVARPFLVLACGATAVAGGGGVPLALAGAAPGTS
ncbi:hypothetical protein SDC9_67688 [bioreactor metagenome]|uniref:Uncharacterized protein n=1 Tax=bioreactor metagenome TaxID=1076179 RepID=A0A644Y4Z3_9ZZZZ